MKMRHAYQLSKLYQGELFDQIKSDGNHIICLGQEQTKTFLLLAVIRNCAHELHHRFSSATTVIVEPNRELANERARLIRDHTELKVINTFELSIDCEPVDLSGSVVICSTEDAVSELVPREKVNLVIFDRAHLLLLQNVESIRRVVTHFDGHRLITFMCSLIHNNPNVSPVDTVWLINNLEKLFNSKCETSSDLRSLSRQSHLSNLEIVQIEPHDLPICSRILLIDDILKSFCYNITKDSLVRVFLSDRSPSRDSQGKLRLCNLKQLVMVQSCFCDILHSLLHLGHCCTMTTIRLYLTELIRLQDETEDTCNLIAAGLSILNCLYGRLDQITTLLNSTDPNYEPILGGATPQLIELLKYIREAKPYSETTAPICIVHVRQRVIAKVIALWLDKVSRESGDSYSFIKPNYVVGSSRKHRNRMAVDNFDLHHEAAVRDFHMGNCNVLITSATEDRCTDIPRCNLVISFDMPDRFSDYIRAKGNCRSDSSKYIVLISDSQLKSNSLGNIQRFINMERLLGSIGKRVGHEMAESSLMDGLEKMYPPYPSDRSKNPATIHRSVNIINKYCTKLPSDSFTKLSPAWKFFEEKNPDLPFKASVRLPINSPVRQTIFGPPAATKNIAMRLAAYMACIVLHKSRELDDNMMPITKETMRIASNAVPKCAKSVSADVEGSKEKVKHRSRPGAKGIHPGSTKRRQYYRKRIARVFSGPKISPDVDCHLYKFNMTLTCPIPEEQNRRGRRIIDPGDTNRNYAIVCSEKLPEICKFPLFTRSGEVLISVQLITECFKLNHGQIADLKTFHEYTFSKVLRLEKYPTIYDPDHSPFTVLLAPVIDFKPEYENKIVTEIDWSFVRKIVRSNKDTFVPTDPEREKFTFDAKNYEDAVVIPWYRLTDSQPFAYYVAEICFDMTPDSPFPDESCECETFADYFKLKYNVEIYNKNQPVLDVDHTSARLNLLTPRYVNRKGRTLPSSTAKTRRESRENLVQKQLLIPELCSIHPFPASFWRKAVCLPCIFYRLNSLFLAEELRRKVALETQVGFVEPPKGFEWPPLHFGWSLQDVYNVQRREAASEDVAGVLSSAATNSLESGDQLQQRMDGLNLESGSSWWSSLSDESSSSSDEEGEVSSDGGATHSHDRNKCRYYGSWKESKANNRPLIRELFIPSTRNCSTGIDIEPVYQALKDVAIQYDENSTDGQSKQQNEIISVVDQPLVRLVNKPPERPLLKMLSHLFENGDNLLELSGTDCQKELDEWHDLLNKLSRQLNDTLASQKDLFLDNGLELITVDDTLAVDPQRGMQPTFGELLPNREIESSIKISSSDSTQNSNGSNGSAINDVNCSRNPNRGREEWKNISFDPMRTEIDSVGPGPSVILQALTMSNASDGINLERLETVGDSFLKYSITAYLYYTYPTLHEGKLSYLRSTEISNANLYKLGREKRLGEIMSATKFEPNDNWLAPGYAVTDASSQPDAMKKPNLSSVHSKRREIDKALAEVPYDLLLQHSIPDKSLADCVEALIGAYLTASGSRAALLFMKWLGLKVIPADLEIDNESDKQQVSKINGSSDNVWCWLGTPPSPLICLPHSVEGEPATGETAEQLRDRSLAELDRLFYANNLDKFEANIQYKFRDKAYLVQAFTHNSFYTNCVTECHQRLEFLGDAILDYLITRYLFEDPRCHSPGTLTDLRSALVNNTFFASLAVKYKFHKYLNFISDELMHVIDGFVTKFRLDTDAGTASDIHITKGYTLLVGEGESEYAEDIEVPKALGDVFESIAGAIFLDSGMSLDQVWRVYFQMMRPEIEYFSKNVPKSPIRELLESMPQNVRFSPSEMAPDGKNRVIAEVFGLGRFTGVGRNKHSAKSTAAKRALRMLALRKRSMEVSMEQQKSDRTSLEENQRTN